mgnify:CR=1 FL=1
MNSFIVKGQCEILLVVENGGPEKDRFLVMFHGDRRCTTNCKSPISAASRRVLMSGSSSTRYKICSSVCTILTATIVCLRLESTMISEML